MKIMRETWVMGIICLLDLVMTIWLIHAGLAKEANPVMLALLNAGLLWFIAFKFAYTLGPLALLEMVGRRYPTIVRKYMRLGITVYIGFHVVNIGCALLASRIAPLL
jgi:hypothetical protein